MPGPNLVMTRWEKAIKLLHHFELLVGWWEGRKCVEQELFNYCYFLVSFSICFEKELLKECLMFFSQLGTLLVPYDSAS